MNAGNNKVASSMTNSQKFFDNKGFKGFKINLYFTLSKGRADTKNKHSDKDKRITYGKLHFRAQNKRI